MTWQVVLLIISSCDVIQDPSWREIPAAEKQRHDTGGGMPGMLLKLE